MAQTFSKKIQNLGLSFLFTDGTVGFSGLDFDPWGMVDEQNQLSCEILGIRDPCSFGHADPLAEGTGVESGDEDRQYAMPISKYRSSQ